MNRAVYLSVIASFLSSTALADSLSVQMESAADHHVAAQGRYKGGLDHSWEYNFGSGKSATNITGVVAHGLLAAHKLTGLQEHEESALRAAKSLLGAYDQGWSRKRPHTQDVEFLAAAGFIIDAARWFKLHTSRYSPEAYVDRVLRFRSKTPAVAAWDVSSAIRAAVAVGDYDYARGLLAALLERRAAWDRQGKAGGQALGRGSLLWAMADVRDRAGLTPEQTRVAEAMVRELVEAQHRSGAWLLGSAAPLCTQSTSYAILGLTRWSDGKKAAEAGRAWLRTSSLTDGRFFMGGRMWATTYKTNNKPDNSFNSEIQSEAMMALASGV